MGDSREAFTATGEKTWNYTVIELSLALSFFRIVFFLPRPQMDLRIRDAGTNGSAVAYQPRCLLQCFVNNPRTLRRTCFHLFLHCISHHVYHVPAVAADKENWDLVADVAIEYLANSLDEDILRRTESDTWHAWHGRFLMESRIMTVKRIYRSLQGMDLSYDKQEELRRIFWRYDHDPWKNPETRLSKTEEKSLSAEEKRWEDAAEHVEKMLLVAGKEAGKGAESSLCTLRVQGEARLSYGEALHRLAVEREVMETNSDVFDYGFYYYGMEHYGSIPLIEEDKYYEEWRIAALVIAVDTSASTQYEDVEQLSAKTLDMFREEQASFQDAKAHLTQYDEVICKGGCCHSPGGLEAAWNSLQLSGGGGTDFRPLLRYLEELTAQGALSGPRGVFYFTDGEGQFPERVTPYQAASVLPGREKSVERHVPVWALKAYLEEKKA